MASALRDKLIFKINEIININASMQKAIDELEELRKELEDA